MLFAIVGAAGNAILFVVTLVYTTIVGAYTVAFAAHSYLTIVQDTAVGLDRVKWPQEGAVGWAVRAIPLAGVLLLLVVPCAFLARALGPSLLPDDPGLVFVLLVVPVVWMFFPVALLATMGRNGTARADVLGGMARNAPNTLAFYLLTGGLMVAAGGLWYAALFTRGGFALLLAAPFGAAVVFIHARLLGRVAWLVGRAGARRVARRPAPREDRRPPRERPLPPARPPRGVAVQDPWAPPGEEAPRPAARRQPQAGYGLAREETPVPPPEPLPPAPRPAWMDEPAEPYAVAAEPAPAAAKPPRESPVTEEAVRRELQMRDRSDPDPPPAHPLFSGVFEFPWYETSNGPWLAVALGLLGTGLGFRGLVLFWPG